MLRLKLTISTRVLGLFVFFFGVHAAAFDVEYSGCAEVLNDGSCGLGSGRILKLWLQVEPTTALDFSVDDQPLVPANRVSIDGGQALTLEIPVDAKKLRLATNNLSWSLSLVEVDRPEIFTLAGSSFRQGNYKKAIAQLNAALPELAVKWRGLAHKRIGQAHRNRGETTLARESLRRAIAADTAQGKYSEAIKSATVLVFMQLESGDNLDQSRALLRALLPAPQGDAQSNYYIDYFLGLTEFNAGNARGALDHLQRAGNQARRMQEPMQRSYAESLLAVQLQQIGRREQAAALLAPWVNNDVEDIPECQKAGHIVNYVWAQLLVLEGGGVTENPLSLAHQANQMSEKCSNLDKNSVLSNLALSLLHADDADGAADVLAQVDRQSEALTLRTILWLWDIKARVAIAQGNLPEAFEQYQALSDVAEATLSPSARWRAVVGIASVQSQLGDKQAALDSYKQAEQILSDDMFMVPLEAGRETLLTTRQSAVADHVQLLLDLDRKEAAFQLARRSRNRLLDSMATVRKIPTLAVAQRTKWESALSEYRTIREELDNQVGNAWALPADELKLLKQRHEKLDTKLNALVDQAITAAQFNTNSSLREPDVGETMLAFYPLKKGWVSFADSAQGLTVVETSCRDIDSSQLASCLVRPFIDKIKRASVVRVLPVGVLKNVDFHALLIEGKPIIEFASVVYGADIGVLPNATKWDTSRIQKATLVADGAGDLSGAREEMKRVGNTLNSTKRWQLTSYSGDQAQHSMVRDSIEQSDVFHFAGHARFSGDLGWGSELVLANQSGFNVADIITLEQVPRMVVLSGCETATTSQDSLPESIGLANAFLTAGTHHVLATSRVVNDDTAREMMDVFYREWVGGSEPHEALRLAQRAVSQRWPEADWSAYRLIEH